MNTRMILTDLDHTLLRSDGTISEHTKQVLISLSDIVSFGDDINDIEMLRICGTGVAVSNAVAEVKAVADCVTLSMMMTE